MGQGVGFGIFCIQCSDVLQTDVCFRTDQKAVRLNHTPVCKKPDTGITENPEDTQLLYSLILRKKPGIGMTGDSGLELCILTNFSDFRNGA